MKRIILLLAAVMVSVATLQAQEPKETKSGKAQSSLKSDEAKTRFLPMRQRIDRNIDSNKFVFKGEVMVGLTASYGTLNAADSDLLMIIDEIDLGFSRATVNPFVAYAYRDNRAVGMRFGYESLKGNLGNVALDLGSIADLSFSLANMSLTGENFAWSIFHRNYMGLDRRGIVGAILEAELLVRTGHTTFMSGTGDSRTFSRSNNFSARLNLNPGLGVYIFPQVCVTVTVGIGGLYYNSVRQVDAYGVELGSRNRTGLQFKLNIADIQIGVVAHLWNKKKN